MRTDGLITITTALSIVNSTARLNVSTATNYTSHLSSTLFSSLVTSEIGTSSTSGPFNVSPFWTPTFRVEESTSSIVATQTANFQQSSTANATHLSVASHTTHLSAPTNISNATHPVISNVAGLPNIAQLESGQSLINSSNPTQVPTSHPPINATSNSNTSIGPSLRKSNSKYLVSSSYIINYSLPLDLSSSSLASNITGFTLNVTDQVTLNNGSSRFGANLSAEATAALLNDPGLFFCQHDRGEVPSDTVSQRVYFEFTEDNINESRVAECYAQWSSIYHESPEWKEKGEVWLFAWHFAETGNFQCWFNEEGQCPETPSLNTLFQLYSSSREDWPHIRRVYFLFMKLNKFHQYIRVYNDLYKSIHVYTRDLVPDFIEYFTPHADDQDLALCRVRQTVLDIFVKASLSLISQSVSFFTGGLLGPIMNDAMSQATDAFSSKIAKKLSDKLLEEVQDNIRQFPQNVWGQNFDLISNEIQSQINTNIPYSKPGESYRSKNSWTIDSINNNPLCNDLDVQGPDHTKKNIEGVQKGLTNLMEFYHTALEETYEHLFRGEYPSQDNQQSALSYILGNTKWVGEHSVSAVIRNSRPLKSALKIKVVKIVASKILRDGHSYVKCTYEKDALHHCQTARDGKHNGFSNAIFCPRPDQDPTFICVAARIMLDATGTTREMDCPIAPNREWENPDWRLQKFPWPESMTNITFESLMLENDRNYQENRNTGFMQVGQLGLLDTVGGFQLPTCVHEHVHLIDFTVSRNHHWYGGFPMICGDHRANETAAFLEDIGISSEPLIQRDIFTDRMPRSLNGVSPYEYFMALCKMRVRWSTTTHDDMAFNTTHEQCGNVSATTQSMSYYEANEWFCNSPEGKAILKGEETYYYWTDRNSECDAWRAAHYYGDYGDGEDKRLGPKPTSEELKAWNKEADHRGESLGSVPVQRRRRFLGAG